MRPGTRIALALLFLALFVTAAIQVMIASEDRPDYPGPVPSTPLPVASPGATSPSA